MRIILAVDASDFVLNVVRRSVFTPFAIASTADAAIKRVKCAGRAQQLPHLGLPCEVSLLSGWTLGTCPMCAHFVERDLGIVKGPSIAVHRVKYSWQHSLNHHLLYPLPSWHRRFASTSGHTICRSAWRLLVTKKRVYRMACLSLEARRFIALAACCRMMEAGMRLLKFIH